MFIVEVCVTSCSDMPRVYPIYFWRYLCYLHLSQNQEASWIQFCNFNNYYQNIYIVQV